MYMWDQKTKTYKDFSHLAEDIKLAKLKDYELKYRKRKSEVEQEIEACQIAIECYEAEIKKLRNKIKELDK